jgi:iron complex outermembrane receptor protein
MIKHYLRRLVPLLAFQAIAIGALAQTVISGKVTDAASGEPLPGVNIVVKGTIQGNISDKSGQFSISVQASPPITLAISFIGFKSQEISITEAQTSNLEIKLEEESTSLNEIVIGVSRISEKAIDAPVTNEKMDRVEIQQAATPDFYDAMANMKGVMVNTGSLNMTSVNTRGFATIANTRFVQWVDGMDTQAPLLNFPTGNIVGIGELDVESVELIPGAASALYGPNAFNGIMIMNSKSPFDFQGLSAQVKEGIVKSDAGGSHPMHSVGIRYAKAFFNNKLAIKANFSYMTTTDWLGKDYVTDRNNPESTVDLRSQPNFDGLNTSGDETRIPVPIGGTFGTLDLRRTGYTEEDLLKVFDDNRDVKSLKYDGAVHYRINDKLEALYNYRFGGGSSIYQGTEKYILRDFTQQFHKVELRGSNFFLRAYQTTTDAGDSYNMSALGGFLNETISPTATQWAPTYAQTYVLAMQGYVPGVPAGDPAAAHAAGRASADASRPAPGSQQFIDYAKAVRNNFFQQVPTGAAGGASFKDNSKLYHVEANYKLFEQIKWAEIQVGGNYRQYNLFSSGTIFNEAPEDGTNFQRVKINEFGAYTQVAKAFGDLKLTGSLRFDKNENFDGQLTPRIAAVYKLAENNNLRASFQTGFRNPDTQAQFIYFPSSSGTLLGSTEANAGRYGVHNGGAYTFAAYNAFRAAGGTLDPTTGTPSGSAAALAIIQNPSAKANVAYVQPEQLKAFEVGYKGILGKNFMIDLNYYFSQYTDFIGGQIVAIDHSTTHQGNQVNAGSLYSLYNNSTKKVSSQGLGLGLTYNLPRNFEFNGNYNYADFTADETADFRSGFNTPKNRFSVGIANRKLLKSKNLGFNINFRWQETFLWQSSYGEWNVPEYGVLDAQINYKVPKIKTMFKIGGTNLGGGDYRTNLGSPFIGQMYYISLTFDEFLR